MSHIRYDAVVIGAGNSGIVAALELAQAGKKTLLIEKNNTPGGCSTPGRTRSPSTAPPYATLR